MYVYKAQISNYVVFWIFLFVDLIWGSSSKFDSCKSYIARLCVSPLQLGALERPLLHKSDALSKLDGLTDNVDGSGSGLGSKGSLGSSGNLGNSGGLGGLTDLSSLSLDSPGALGALGDLGGPGGLEGLGASVGPNGFSGFGTPLSRSRSVGTSSSQGGGEGGDQKAQETFSGKLPLPLFQTL